MQKKQGNFRVFCNDALPPSRCGQASATRRRQLRWCAPACPLAEKKFRDRMRFRHRTSANAQKCANFFASCGDLDARDASRTASPRRDTSHHRDTTCTHVADTPPRMRRPSPTSTSCFHRCRRMGVSTGADRTGRRLTPAHTAPSHIGDVRSAATSPLPASPTHIAPACRAAPAPRRKTGTDRRVDRMHQLPTARANALPSRCCPVATSHRLRSDARGDAGDAGSGIAMQRMAPPTRGRWRPHRAAPKKKPAALGGRFGCRDGQSAQWPSSSSSSAYSSGDSSSFNCSASSASSTRIQPSP